MGNHRLKIPIETHATCRHCCFLEAEKERESEDGKWRGLGKEEKEGKGRGKYEQ